MSSRPEFAPATDAPQTREAWIEMKLIQTFMNHAAPALRTAAAMVVLVVVMLYGHVDTSALVLWALAVSALIALRHWVTRRYRKQMDGVSGPRLHAFMVRYGWTWWVSAGVWGSLIFVFFLRAPAYQQFICLTLLVALPGLAIGTFSSYLPGFLKALDSLMLTVAVALAHFLVKEDGMPSGFNTYGMLFLALVYWAVIRMSGKRIHAVYRANLELAFDNNALVSSLTEQSRAALEAVAVKNRFIASAAHDLRQPVHALALYASWLAAEPALVAEISPKISRSTRAVNDLFNSLFEFSGLDSEAARVRLQWLDVAALLHDLQLQYEPLARERGLQLRIRSCPRAIRSDAILLKRLLGNLISNALKNTRTGGVLVAARRWRGGCRIEVWDTGCGIAEEHRDAIFQEFYRIPQTGTEDGFGLGLTIVSRLSQLLDHRVELASRVGRGSVFRLSIAPTASGPLSNATAAPESAPDGWPANGS